MQERNVEIIVLVDPIEDVDDEVEESERFWKTVGNLTVRSPISLMLYFHPKNIFGGDLSKHKRYLID